MNIAIVFAGGSGVRMGAGVPKQFLEINGKPIIVHTLQLFQCHDMIDKIYISVLADYIPYMKELVDEYRLNKVADVIPGGETAQDSIYNALKKAETYSNSLHMSKQGIYNQLTSSVEGFTKEAAQYAIDNIEVDWNKNALEKAKTYQTSMSMSSKAIYNQLISSAEGFTKSEAQYAIDNLDK